MLRNPKIFGFYKFLESALSKIVLFNKKFQSSKLIVPENKPEMQNVYTYYLRRFMDGKYVESQLSSLKDVDLDDESNYKPLENVILGKNAEIFIESIKMSESKKNEFRKSCRDFYIELCKQIKQRYDFDDDHSINLRCFHKKNARNSEFHKEFEDLNQVFLHFKSIIDENGESKKDMINNEWQLLLNYGFSDEVEQTFLKCDVEKFWFTLLNYKNSDGQEIFSNLADFALDAISIPNSNATPERTWSKMNLEKTKYRNRLKYPALRAVMLSSQYVRDVGGFKLFVPTEEMIERMRYPIYSVSKKKNKEKDGKKTYTEYLGRRINESLIVGAVLEDQRYKKPFSELAEIDGVKKNHFIQDYLRGMLEENGTGEYNCDDDVFCDELLDHYKDCPDESGEDDNEGDIVKICYSDSDTASIGSHSDDDCTEDVLPIDDFMIFLPKNKNLKEHSYYSLQKEYDSQSNKKRKTEKSDSEISQKKIKLENQSISSTTNAIMGQENSECQAINSKLSLTHAEIYEKNNECNGRNFNNDDINKNIDSILLTVNKSLSQKLFGNECNKITDKSNGYSSLIGKSSKIITQNNLGICLDARKMTQEHLNIYFSSLLTGEKIIMNNGLISHFNHYTVVSRYDTVKHKRVQIPPYVIGRYSSIENHCFRNYDDPDALFFKPNYKFPLFSKEYQTLFYVGRKGYLDGDVIDAVSTLREKK